MDCDQHGGNGTAEFTRRFNNLFNFDIYGLAFGCPSYAYSETRHIHKDKGTFSRIIAIHETFQAMQLDWKADLVSIRRAWTAIRMILAALDGLKTEYIQHRERMVLHWQKNTVFPHVLLAGGYQALEPLVQLHVETIKIAQHVYFTN